jgi:hypothetical protein
MEQSTSFLPELFSDANIDFQNHIAPAENARIIFSGKYGMGKTTFLEKFFQIDEKESSASKKYEVIRLFPVNYSVGSNQDIFRYIKYDILIEFLRKGVELESLNLDISQYVALYAQDKWTSIGAKIAQAAAAVGKHADPRGNYVETILNFFIGQKKHLDKYIQEKKEKFDEAGIAAEFLNKMESTDDNPYEQALISRIIEKKIEELRKGGDDKNKQVVLIIDDMDRIDPEHIFRILNVFAAHFDLSHNRNANKFGFDKIILVCDIDNIYGAFRHKYGPDTNFSGYMDKFYSDDVYCFKIVDHICDYILKLTNKYSIQHVPEEKYKFQHYAGDIFHWLIRSFVRSGALNLRSLTKFIDRGSSISLRQAKMIDSVEIKITDQNLIWTLVLMGRIFGDRAAYLAAIENLPFEALIEEGIDHEKVFKIFLTVATLSEHKLLRNSTGEHTILKTNVKVSYSTNRMGEGPIPIANFSFGEEPLDGEDLAIAINQNFIPLMYDAVTELYTVGFLS